MDPQHTSEDLFARAERILKSPVLADKLEPIDILPIPNHRDPRRIDAPARCADLQISADRIKMPGPLGLRDPAQRRRILHALANHELQAVELFAWAMLAFSDLPPAFHHGLRVLLVDEQRHCKLYLQHLFALGGRFGELPVNGHFWHFVPEIQTPIQFLAVMGLTFESANLDFACHYETVARDAGLLELADVFATVHREECNHVRFAHHWLSKLQPTSSTWHTYQRALPAPLTPARARASGDAFRPESRRAAGLTSEFIHGLAEAR